MAKICILASDNKQSPYKEGYKKLLAKAGVKPQSQIRPVGVPPCTKRILQVLDETKVITRKMLRDQLKDEGYNITTIRSALKRLDISSRIVLQGSSCSPSQSIQKKCE